MNTKFKIIIFLVLFLVFGKSTLAATSQIYFSLPTGSVAPGSVVSVEVYVDATEAINALEGEITYPSDLLQSVGFDNQNSIVGLWQMKPKVTTSGVIGFSGGMLDPFSGTKGKVIKLQFKTLQEGTPKLSFTKSIFYKADGKGTVLSPSTKSFSLTVAKSGESVSEDVTTFQNTAADSEVERGVKSLQTQTLWKKSLVFGIPALILLFILFLLYNKSKRQI